MQILTALALAIVPVLNSFMILLILASTCEAPHTIRCKSFMIRERQGWKQGGRRRKR